MLDFWGWERHTNLVIPRRTVSLHDNSSAWLDTQDVSIWDQNPVDYIYIYILNGGSLKLVDKFSYLSSSISSSERDINMNLAMAWTAIYGLSIIWRSDLSDKIKRNFFLAVVVSNLLYGCTKWTLTKRFQKYLDGNYTRMLQVILEARSSKTAAVTQPTSHL